MWIVLGVLAVMFVVAMCSGEKSPEPRVRGILLLDPPAPKTGWGEILFGGLMICAGGYLVVLLLPYLLGALGIGIALAIALHFLADSK